MEAKKRTRLLPICLVLVVAYIALFPNRAGRETVVRPAWSTSTESTALGGRGEGRVHAFRVGDRFGYVDESGTLLRLERVFHDVAVDDTYYVNYAKGTEAMALRGRDGGIVSTVPGGGWPLLHDRLGDAVMLFDSDLLGMAELSVDGAKRWERELGSFITCFAVFPEAAEKARCAVGTLDGRLRVLGRDGVDLYRMDPVESRVACTYGCTVSPDGRQVAVVQGLGPQRLAVLDEVGGAYQEAWSRDLDLEARSERLLCYSGDSRYLVMDGSRGILVQDARGRHSWIVSAEGVLSAAAPAAGVVALELRRNGGAGELVVLAPPDLVLARSEVSSGYAPERHLAGYDGYFVYGAGRHVTRLDVLRL